VETRRRHELKTRIEHFVFRIETVLWISVTGAIWMARRKSTSTEERGNQLAEILASYWVMQRWRRVIRRASGFLLSDHSERQRSANGTRNAASCD
jgi:hypothetical protein